MAEARTPVEQLNELIRDIKFAMLATIQPDGMVYSCPMATQEADAEGRLWFFTGSDTDKVDAIRENPQVCVAYADPERQRYVSVSGLAELQNNPDKKKELWNPLYKAWFPQGVDDPKLVLIKVLITDAEYWHAPEGKMVQLLGFAEAAITGERYQPAGYREIEFPENRHDVNR
jgi:general stress protein 26